MSAWLERLVGPEYAVPALWIVSGLLLLVLLLVLVRLLRGFASGTFVAGGRNRRARLAVMDAAAVDSRRRLVLVRRDDVEHLILIGGPTDLVIEQDIRMMTPGRRHTDVAQEHAVAQQQPASPAREPAAGIPRPRLVAPPPRAPAPPLATVAGSRNGASAPRPAAVPVQAASPAPASPPPTVSSVPAAMPQPAPPPVRPMQATSTPPPPSQSAPPIPPAPPPESVVEPSSETPPLDMEPSTPSHPAVVTPLPVADNAPPPQMQTSAAADEEALLRELEVTLDSSDRITPQPDRQPAPGPDEISLEEEMSKLLGDLSGERR